MKKEFSDGVIDDPILLSHALVLQRVEDGDVHVLTNVPHLVVAHSPDGFEFGYAGSGPADLALNICQYYLLSIGYQGKKEKCFEGECFSLAWALHQDFKFKFIAAAPHEGIEIPFEMIREWFEAHITDEIKQRHSPVDIEIEE